VKEIYEKIVKVLKKYIVMDERHYPIVALWVIGTYFHKNFRTYPYLFFNAMKGSGKSRMLGLLAHLSYNGKVIVDMTESVLFRTASTTAFFIDELENINRKEKISLRLLLNSAYKQGTHIRRMKKEKENYVVEEFVVFTPIAMANISGMDDVLEDRCVTIVLEKSFDPYVTSMIEDWDVDVDIKEVKSLLNTMISDPSLFFAIKRKFSVVSAVSLPITEHITTLWNELLYYIKTTLTTHISLQTLNNTNSTKLESTQKIIRNPAKISADRMLECLSQLDYSKIGVEPGKEMIEFIKKLWSADLNGRDLELFMPIIMISYNISPELMDEVIAISETITKAKKAEDVAENRDTALIGFLLEKIDELGEKSFIRTAVIAKEFKEEEGEDWINSRWVGRSLKRMKFIVESRRLARGREVILDQKKIKETAGKLGIERQEKEDAEQPEPTEEQLQLGTPEILKKRGSK